MFYGKTHYKWSCSIAMFNYQRVMIIVFGCVAGAICKKTMIKLTDDKSSFSARQYRNRIFFRPSMTCCCSVCYNCYLFFDSFLPESVFGLHWSWDQTGGFHRFGLLCIDICLLCIFYVYAYVITCVYIYIYVCVCTYFHAHKYNIYIYV